MWRLTTTVPNDTEIHFYTENLKALLDNTGCDIETMSAAFDDAPTSTRSWSAADQ